MKMELKYLEINGVLVALPLEKLGTDANDDVVARISEMAEQMEATESTCVVLSTSAAF
jgi:hypothetical protein